MRCSVLMYCPQFRPAVGGAERQAEMLATALVAAGCGVTVLTPRIDPASPAVEDAGGVRIERFPLSDLSRRFQYPGIALINIPFILWQVVRAVFTRLRRHSVIHCHIASLQTAAVALAGAASSLPVLVTAHTASRHSDLGNIEKASRSGRLVAWLVRGVLKDWVAVSAAVERELLAAGIPAKSVSRIPNGVELTALLPDRIPRRNVKRFLYLGRLATTAERDVPTLINAFDRLARENNEVELALVGGGDLLEETRVLAEAKSAAARIYMPGFDDPHRWHEWADCFVLPSRYEGLSLALLEAMAAGLPCIANDIAPNREVLADGAAGILVPVSDEDRLFHEMQRMATDNAHAETMSRSALAAVNARYSISAVAEMYINLYNKLRNT